LNHLELNVKKTKQLTVDFSKTSTIDSSLFISGDEVENVTEYKYLGTIVDQNFSFSDNVDMVYKKINSRVYFVRQMKKLDIDTKIMDMFYNAIVQSVISFSITCWYGNSTNEAKSKICKVIKACRRLGVSCMSLYDVYEKYSQLRCTTILNESEHPLHDSYTLLPSGRRFRSIKCRTSRYLKSFVPNSIRMYNSKQ
jgi:hypothetical protein